MNDLSRRELLAAAAMAACACVMSDPACLLAADENGSTTTPTTIDIGPKTAYAEDGINDKWIKKPNAIAVVRNGGKLYAFTSICTHKGGVIAKVDETVAFRCPLHKAEYANTGAVTKGPAKIALARYAISVNDAGHVIVDKTKSFTEEHWDDAASFIAMA
jgi:cytochrome b6-f complex iron-sulfur subunit